MYNIVKSHNLPLEICPAGYICDNIGLDIPTKPCPPGYLCLKGTIGIDPLPDYELKTVGKICFDNSTSDYGLQSSNIPSRFWGENHSLPLDSPIDTEPFRGMFCGNERNSIKVEHFIRHGLDIGIEYNDMLFHYPIPCPLGSFCNAAVALDTCRDGDYCPAGSTNPRGLGPCPKGSYCRAGKRFYCPVGTYCPNTGLSDPLPCKPGTFNFMVGQDRCSVCQPGQYCPGYGRVDPMLCKPGFVCSIEQLESPNKICPAGFYCPVGTATSDPFRNDTTLRPYPCSPGSYCPTGVGYNSIVEGDLTHAQPCSAGFYCEVGSVSAKGSGTCPPAFICPKGTATPVPTRKGHYASYRGMISDTKCLPGFYAPTIETAECIPCPPGTSCEGEGHVVAESCPPGMYRGPINRDGIPCMSCPQGTWSKNWNLRDVDECIRCAPGTVCSKEGLTTPCSKMDLPTPFIPVVNLNGVPVPEFHFKPDEKPPGFSVEQCLELNKKDNAMVNSLEQIYFFGELVPPYIDILGRGAHFRVTEDQTTIYGVVAKCYQNSQREGSLIFQRYAQFLGPQFDIQTGFPHQNYGSQHKIPKQLFKMAPLEGSSLDKQYFYSEGMTYIPLPRSSRFQAAFNCTPGFSLMNSTLIKRENQIVYTSSDYDNKGGHDIEKCPYFDPALQCFTDPTFQVHKQGFCCDIGKWSSRAIYMGHDQYYPGTCEADIICNHDDEKETESTPCFDGFVCDENTNLTESTQVSCPEGYTCSFGSTPDVSLEATGSQYQHVCGNGYVCPSGTGVSQLKSKCPKDYFCPSGTADAVSGIMANDAINRNLLSNQIDPQRNQVHLRYFNDDNFILLTEQESICLMAEDESISDRMDSHTHTNTMVTLKSLCARDNKWAHVLDAVRRGQCDCHEYLQILLVLGRLKLVSPMNLACFSYQSCFS